MTKIVMVVTGLVAGAVLVWGLTYLLWSLGGVM